MARKKINELDNIGGEANIDGADKLIVVETTDGGKETKTLTITNLTDKIVDEKELVATPDIETGFEKDGLTYVGLDDKVKKDLSNNADIVDSDKQTWRDNLDVYSKSEADANEGTFDFDYGSFELLSVGEDEGGYRGKTIDVNYSPHESLGLQKFNLVYITFDIDNNHIAKLAYPSTSELNALITTDDIIPLLGFALEDYDGTENKRIKILISGTIIFPVAISSQSTTQHNAILNAVETYEDYDDTDTYRYGYSISYGSENTDTFYNFTHIGNLDEESITEYWRPPFTIGVWDNNRILTFDFTKITNHFPATIGRRKMSQGFYNSEALDVYTSYNSTGSLIKTIDYWETDRGRLLGMYESIELLGYSNLASNENTLQAIPTSKVNFLPDLNTKPGSNTTTISFTSHIDALDSNVNYSEIDIRNLFIFSRSMIAEHNSGSDSSADDFITELKQKSLLISIRWSNGLYNSGIKYIDGRAQRSTTIDEDVIDITVIDSFNNLYSAGVRLLISNGGGFFDISRGTVSSYPRLEVNLFLGGLLLKKTAFDITQTWSA